MTDGLDIVAVGIQYKGAVIILVVMRPKARSAIVLAARRQRHKDYYGAFVLDPDGHNIEAVCHLPE